MPTYQYHCADCGRDLEIFQSFSEDSLTVCPECQGKLKKVFSPAGIVFKGSGFYVTDSGRGSKSASSGSDAKPSADTSASSTSSSDSSSSSTSATPAKD